ncbi:hypothetical protein ACIF6L_24635 [Kitasatospora sp. NPDC086009]|uniref:hypothetical protein n=1 Tax=unclassified Kitasatospora TaxID=2633591 RepID=UPI0037CB100B
MASAQEWTLKNGTARVFPANGSTLVKPLILAAQGKGPADLTTPEAHAEATKPTDLAAFEAGVDDPSYSFLGELRARGYDLILVGYNKGVTRLADQSQAVIGAIHQAAYEWDGDGLLTVGGIGRGALAARHALTKMEVERQDHRTQTYFSYNGSAPFEEESTDLRRLGGWPLRPIKFKLVSGDFTSRLNDDDFDESTLGAANTGKSLITKELGSWLLNKLN